MDVVKTNIEKIGGTIDLQSQRGQGTTIRLNLPLTLAIVPALIVTCGGAPYAIPQANLQELVRLEGGQGAAVIERLYSAHVLRLRGQLLPIVYLRGELRLDASNAASDEAGQAINIVVLRAAGKAFGLVVDSIRDMQEIVVQALSRELAGIGIYAGATIMGSGQVALILDVPGIARRARVLSEARHGAQNTVENATAESSAPRQTLLIVQVGNRRLGIRLDQVARLEDVSPDRIELSETGEVIQYCGQIMPLVRLHQALGVAANEIQLQPLKVVVHQHEDRRFGFVVDRIGDIVETAIDSHSPDSSLGVASIVVQQRVTDLIDLEALVRRVSAGAFAATRAAEGARA